MKRKMQITILSVCTEVKVCSILPCADGHESHPGHHGNKITKPTLEFLTPDDEQQRQKVSGHRERKKLLHAKTSVKENGAASTNHRQALRCFLLTGSQKPDHFSKKSLPKQEDNVRSFPQPKTGSAPCLKNEWICAQSGCCGGFFAFFRVSLLSRWSTGFCDCCPCYCSSFSPNLCFKSALLQCKPIISSPA